LSDDVRLNVTIIVLARPDKATVALDTVSNHIVDETMLIPKFFGLEFGLVFLFVNFPEDILESAIVLFKNSVFGGQVERIIPLQRILEAGMCELSYRFIGVVHREHHASVLKLVYLKISSLSAVIRDERHDEPTGLLRNKISSTILVTKSMAANDDRLGPARN